MREMKMVDCVTQNGSTEEEVTWIINKKKQGV
jgi:hypothetical protein